MVCVQNSFGIGASAGEQELLRSCGEQGIAYVPFFAIAGAGREAGATATEHQDVLAIAHAHGATPAQIRLAWTLQRGPHVLVIPGTGNPHHLAENVTAGMLRLSDDEMAHLQSFG